MRWKQEDLDIKMTSIKIIFTMMALNLLQTCFGARPQENSRKDLSALYLPEPSAESLTAIAQAMGAAGFEDYTEGKTLVKRLIPADSQPDLDVVEHMGIIGRVGVDFPALPNIPSTGFNCKNVPTGYYADLETDCQVFHICDTSRKISFLCPNGTIFSQSHLICDWWFKVDCASAPALYEASVEYYSNEQKKAQKVGRNFSKNRDIQQIGADTNVRAESRRAPVHIPSTTERLLRHRQKLQSNGPVPTDTPTSRSYQALFEISPTHSATEFEKRRKNLVQLISNDFGNHPSKTTLPVYDSTTRKTILPVYDHNSLKEMQVAEETASFANNQNRQFLQEYNSKTFRPYPIYTPNLPSKTIKPKNSPTLTTLYDITSKTVPQYTQEATTKRQTLVPYTKTYTTTDNREPYTRPGVSLLREFLEKEKNKTISATTDKIIVATGRSDTYESKKSPENKSIFESATKIPYTIRDNKKPSQIIPVKDELVSSTPTTETAAEISYKDRRERLQKKLELDREDKTEPTLTTIVTEKYYGNQSNRPGLLVPPSLTPKTLHSLAIYYATALDNLATTTAPEEIEVTTHAIDDYDPIEHGLPALFSQQTIAKYGNLFGHESSNVEMLEQIKVDPNGTYNEIAEDLTAQMSQGPLATSPQIRELAQVFTHALSAYLQDPIKFRKVLSDIRPTHPSFAEMLGTTEDAFNTEATTTVNEEDDEILGFSDDHKTRISENTIRNGKSLNIATDYPTTIEEITTTVKPTTDAVFSSYAPTTFRSPFRCCGRISASYTTAPPPRNHIFTSVTNSAAKINSLANYYTETTSTENSNFQSTNGHFQNINTIQQTIADSPYLNDYTETTVLPTRSDVDVFDTTYSPITNSHQLFESKKIRSTTITPESTPIYFTDNDSIELENEEELQRAHSQSFVSPQTNNIRKGKQLKLNENSSFKKPAENLEVPTESAIDVTTSIPFTTKDSTTLQDQAAALTTVNPAASSIFTSPDSDKSTNDFQWPTTFGNWQSTIIDPITLNDGLSPSGHERDVSDIAQQTNVWGLNTATTPSSFSTTNEPAVSTTINVEVTTTNTKQDERFGRLLADVTSTEPAQDLSVVTDSLVEKAKEIMGGMNSTTTQKLMNVMKKTKSKTVKRLILLLVQTCDDDHNSTAEASKKALLEALMAVSQKDMDEIAKEEDLTEAPSTVSSSDVVKTEFNRRMDRIPVQPRRGKSLNIDAEAINSLSTQSTTESIKTEDSKSTTITTARTTRGNRRGSRKYSLRTTELDTQTTVGDSNNNRPVAEARVAPQGESKIQPDTRALELLRSLYTIAARWG